MKIDRIDSEKEMDRDVERIEITIKNMRYTLTESFGAIKIQSHYESISVNPCCANVIDVK